MTVLKGSDAVGGRVRTDVVEGFSLDRACSCTTRPHVEGARVHDHDAWISSRLRWARIFVDHGGYRKVERVRLGDVSDPLPKLLAPGKGSG